MKTKIKHTIQILNTSVDYKDVLSEVNNLKTKIENELKNQGVEKYFEVVVEVENTINGISFIP